MRLMRLCFLTTVMETNRLFSPISAASLAFFRIGFGLVMAYSLARTVAKGWVQSLYTAPEFHFAYFGWTWLKPLPDPWMTFVFVGLIGVSLLVAAGAWYRVSISLFFLGFTYIELIDKATYLNHYYAISLVSFLMIFMPLYQYASVDAWRNPSLACDALPRFYLWLIRSQIGLIYLFAGLAKLNPDWLIHAQPLKIWLSASGHVPLMGAFVDLPWLPYAMSWAGVIYDLSIPFLLLWAVSRPFAYVAVVLFHVMTAMLFSIGMFPWIMIMLTLVFFAPDWPLKWINRLPFLKKKIQTSIALPGLSSSAKQFSIGFASLFLAIQIALPLRHHLYAGDFFWTEQGFRFSWHVMVMEKNGMIEFTAVDPITGQRWFINHKDYLTPLQEKMMRTQADMIVQFSSYLAEKLHHEKGKSFEIYALSYATVNGSPSQIYVNPKLNLADARFQKDPYQILDSRQRD